MLKSKVLLLFVLAACWFAACKSDPAYDRSTQLAIDDDIINRRLTVEGTRGDYQKSPDGIYYIINREGEGVAPTPIDTVGVHYVARHFLTQNYYDSTLTNRDTTRFVLASSIEGWQKTIPLIKPGGRIRMIVPSPLAYQNRQIDTLRPNTILDFDIQLLTIDPKKENVTTNP